MAAEEIEVPEIIKELVMHMVQSARSIAETGEDLVSVVILHNSNTQLTSIGMLPSLSIDPDWPAEKAKKEADIQIKHLNDAIIQLIRNEQADVMLLINEAWGLSDEDKLKHDEIIQRYGSINNYPNKIDTVAFSLQTRHYGDFTGVADFLSVLNYRTFGPPRWVKVGPRSVVITPHNGLMKKAWEKK